MPIGVFRPGTGSSFVSLTGLKRLNPLSPPILQELI